MVENEEMEQYEDNNDAEKDVVRNRELQKRRFEKEVSDYDSVDQMLQEIPDGFKVSVYRVNPRWCEGHVETVLVHRDEATGLTNMDADELRRAYGGHTLALRFLNDRGGYVAQKTITFADEPPKRNGKVILSPEEKEELKLKEQQAEKQKKEQQDAEFKMMDLVTKLISDKKEDNSGNALIAMVMSQMQESSRQMAQQQQYAQKLAQDNMAIQMKMMEKMMSKGAPDPMDQFAQTMQIMTMSKELLGGGNEDKSSDEIQSMVGNIIGMMGNKSNSAPQRVGPPPPPPIPRPVNSSVSNPVLSGAPEFKVNAEKFEKPIENEKKVASMSDLGDNDDIVSLSAKLAEMDESKLATLISDTLANIPKKKQDKIFNAFEALGDEEDA